MKNMQKIFREDNDFWDAVNLSISTIFRVFGVSMCRSEITNPITGDTRIVAAPEERSLYPWIVDFYYFFASSPDCFIPDGKLVADMRNGVPAVFGKRELLVSLWRMAGGQDNTEVSEMCRKIDVVFRREMESSLDLDFDYWLSQCPEEVRRARKVLEDLYKEWNGYIVRHYNRALKGMDDQSKQRFNIRLLEGKRNHEMGYVGPTVASMFHSIQLLDRTLCVVEKGMSREAWVGCAISKKYLLQIMKQYSFPAKYLPEIKRILRLDQKIRLNEQRTRMTSQVQDSDFVFVNRETVYNISFSEDSDSFDCEIVPFQYKVPVVKSIYIQDTRETKLPKEYLYALSDGSWECFCGLAKIVCYAVAAKKIFHGVVVGEEQSIAQLTVLLEWIGGREENCADAFGKLSFLSKVAAKDNLIDMKIDGRLFGVCYDDVNRLNPDQWERLAKILSGSTVTYKDSVLERKMHKNTMQWIVFGDDFTYQKFKAHGIKTVMAPVARILDDVEDRGSLWLQIVLPLWGYLLHKKVISVQSVADAKMPVIRHFVDSCCQLLDEDGAFLAARELYEHYYEFCQKIGRKDVLKFKDFNDALEKEYNLKRSRFHAVDGTNKTGFRRIRFVGMESAAPQTLMQPTVNREQFFNRLDQITEEVKNHFPNWPFGELF